mgnify:CR=1 FL=1
MTSQEPPTPETKKYVRYNWNANEKTELAVELEMLRKKRNGILSRTDWMANSDVTMSDNWKTYRQALRDLPSGLDTVAKVEAKQFPTKPSE